MCKLRLLTTPTHLLRWWENTFHMFLCHVIVSHEVPLSVQEYGQVYYWKANIRFSSKISENTQNLKTGGYFFASTRGWRGSTLSKFFRDCVRLFLQHDIFAISVKLFSSYFNYHPNRYLDNDLRPQFSFNNLFVLDDCAEERLSVLLPPRALIRPRLVISGAGHFLCALQCNCPLQCPLLHCFALWMQT